MIHNQTTDSHHDFNNEWYWSTPLLVRTFDDVDSLNAKLQEEIMASIASLPMVGRRYDGALLKHDFFNQESKQVQSLKKKIFTCLFEIDDFSNHKNLKSEDSIDLDGWPLICVEGGFVPPHTHPNSLWSGVYYVSCEAINERRSGVLELIDPRNGVDFFIAPGRPFSRSIFIHPKAGMIVIFPSWLKHLVHPYFGSIPRISIPFNISII